MSTTLEIMQPVSELPDWLTLIAPGGEHEDSTGPVKDDLQKQAEDVGRSNVSYDHVWKKVKEANGQWVPVKCNSMRRAILLASSALQHRTQGHVVRRRGRLVCIRLLEGAANAA